MRGNDITRLCLSIIGAILRSLHQTERGEIAGHVQRPAGAAPGHVPRSPGECARQEGWVRLQDGLHTLPEEVSVQTQWCDGHDQVIFNIGFFKNRF